MFKIKPDIKKSFRCSIQNAVAIIRVNPEDQIISAIMLCTNIYLNKICSLLHPQQLISYIRHGSKQLKEEYEYYKGYCISGS